MKANSNKCHFPTSCKDKRIKKVRETEIENSKYEKLLGIKFDMQLYWTSKWYNQ